MATSLRDRVLGALDGAPQPVSLRERVLGELETPFFSSPGMDTVRMAPAILAVAPTAPAVTAETRVTPAPSPLPAAGSWLERQLAAIDQAIREGSVSYEQGRRQADTLRAQMQGLPGEVASAREDLARAAQLQQMLPLAAVAVGFAVGKPAWGLAAGAALWLWSQPPAPATS